MPWYTHIKDTATDYIHSYCTKCIRKERDSSNISQSNLPRGFQHSESIASTRGGASRLRLGKRQDYFSIDSFDLEDLRRELDNDPQAQPNEEIFEKFVDDLEEFGVDEEPYIVRTQKFNKKGKARRATTWVTSWNGVLKDDDVINAEAEESSAIELPTFKIPQHSTGTFYNPAAFTPAPRGTNFYEPSKSSGGAYYGPDSDAPAPFYNPNAVAAPNFNRNDDNDSAVINFSIRKSDVRQTRETLTINSATNISALNSTRSTKSEAAATNVSSDSGAINNAANASPVSYNTIFKNESRATNDSVGYNPQRSTTETPTCSARVKEKDSPKQKDASKKTDSQKKITSTDRNSIKEEVNELINEAKARASSLASGTKDHTVAKRLRVSTLVQTIHDSIDDDSDPETAQNSKLNKSRDSKISKDVRLSSVAIVINDVPPEKDERKNRASRLAAGEEIELKLEPKPAEPATDKSTGNKKKKKPERKKSDEVYPSKKKRKCSVL